MRGEECREEEEEEGVGELERKRKEWGGLDGRESVLRGEEKVRWRERRKIGMLQRRRETRHEEMRKM